MVEGQRLFPEFQKLLEKERPLVYPEEFDYLGEVALGLVIVSTGIVLSIIIGSFSNLSLSISLILLPIGGIFCFTGLIRNRLGRREYQFRGLSRTALSETVMYLDSFAAKPDDLESAAPYHGHSTHSTYELSNMSNSFVSFIRKTIGIITWPTEFIEEILSTMEKTKKRMVLLPISAVLLAILVTYATLSSLTSEGLIMVVFSYCGAYLLLISYGCIAQSLYYYAKTPTVSRSLSIPTSDMQTIENTLDEILDLLHSEYQYPLRFYVARMYPVLEYTGRTKISFTLVRLREAILYPNNSSQ